MGGLYLYWQAKTKLVTKIFKKTDLKIAYATKNILENLLRP